ncbi:hypothetical protein RJ639_027597 [Escallonia herrerae]|uniref:CCHC-type domain-containing protein n=1 Tax=Escallonia herrerae TaxID=1293975 RepID=A0AA89BG81_9ASTE|nr:hypothetical protein RJ639_027597 [Escallonia herrerae]
MKCYHCQNEGHYRKDCPERKWKKKDNFKTADAGVAEDNFDGMDVLSVTISSSDGEWILDMGCSYHMFLISRDVTFDESSMLAKKKELIDAGKDYGAREKCSDMENSKAVTTPLVVHFKLSVADSPQTQEKGEHMACVPYASAVDNLMYVMVCTRPDVGSQSYTRYLTLYT